MADTGNEPDCVGDLPSFKVTFTPPATDPGATVTGVTVTVCDPDGTTVDDSTHVAQLSPNVWTYTAAAPLDQPGTWSWRIEATGSLVDVREVEREIPKSRFNP